MSEIHFPLQYWKKKKKKKKSLPIYVSTPGPQIAIINPIIIVVPTQNVLIRSICNFCINEPTNLLLIGRCVTESSMLGTPMERCIVIDEAVERRKLQALLRKPSPGGCNCIASCDNFF